MRLNKKGTQMMTWSLTAVMTILFFTAVIQVCSKTSEFSSKTGDIQGEIIKSYDEGEKALIFVDGAAKYSAYGSVNLLGKNGFYFEEPVYYLDGSEKYAMWEGVIGSWEEGIGFTGDYKQEEFYPTESDIRKSFNLFFNEQFNEYAKKYTSTLIPTDNYDIMFDKNGNKIGIIGIATRSITIPPDKVSYRKSIIPTLSEDEKNCLSKDGYVAFFEKEGGNWKFIRCGECPEKAGCERYINEVYCNMDVCDLNCGWSNKCEKSNSKKSDIIHAVKPSFKTEMSYSFIDKFIEYVDKTKEIREDVQNCLLKGSGKPDDEDIETCSDVDELKKEIENMEGYEIKPILEQDRYTQLFDIADDSFEDPYSKEKLVIKFGVQFMDTFPPPATEIINISEKSDGKYLVWKTNNASDVTEYAVYVRKLEPTYIDENDKIAIVEGETEWKIEGLNEGEKYWFYIIAKDNAGNSGRGTMPMELTI